MSNDEITKIKPQQTPTEHFCWLVLNVVMMLAGAAIFNTMVATLFLSWGIAATITVSTISFLIGCYGYTVMFINVWDYTDRELLRNSNRFLNFVLLSLVYIFMPVVVCLVLLIRQVLIAWVVAGRSKSKATSESAVPVNAVDLSKQWGLIFVVLMKLFMPRSLTKA